MAGLIAALPGLGQSILINEVVPVSAAENGGVELYVPGTSACDLGGWSLVSMSGDPGELVGTWRWHQPTLVPGHGHLWIPACSHAEGKEHCIPIGTGARCGSFLLIGPDRRSIADVFAWTALPSGISVGRESDGSSHRAFFPKPTPGAGNTPRSAVHRVLPAPDVRYEEGAVRGGAPPGVEWRFTTDGSVPSISSPLFGEASSRDTPGILTLRAFAPDAVPSPCVSFTRTDPTDGPVIALRSAPEDLYDPAIGILAGGDQANYSRSGRKWQRDVEVEVIDHTTHSHANARLAVSGSGTRGLPKKSFKLFRADPTPDDPLGPWKEVILRADASPNAFLRNLFMERVARSGAHVDVQPSTAVPLYLNGRSMGLYRAMPAKNSDWLLGLCDAEDVDIMDGPAGRTVHGGRKSYAHMVEQLLGDASLDRLKGVIDHLSLIDLACFDLWTGRADHDLNMRCWRPQVAGGRWRWIMYDMDLWAPPDEHTVDRMCSDAMPASPWLPVILSRTDLRDAFLARFTAWMATSLSPEHASVLADSIAIANRKLMRDDYARWKDTLAMPSPDAALNELQAHILRRPAELMAQLAHRSHLTVANVSVQVIPENAGTVALEDLPLTGSACAFHTFAHVPLHLKAAAAPGYEFVEWEGAQASGNEALVDAARVRRVRAVFRLAGTTRK